MTMETKDRLILADMTVLDVVNRFRGTEAVFRNYDQQAGFCICCNALFETLTELCGRHGIDLHRLLEELEKAARE